MTAEEPGKVAAEDQAAAAAAAGKPAAAAARTQRPSANSVRAEAPQIVEAAAAAVPCEECAQNSARLTELEARVNQIAKVVGAALLGVAVIWVISSYPRSERAEVEQ